ncbi:c-type cytochrome [Natribacillus halophilus]|uniref:Cytochrome c550 n=1 Tax=Natribacillus halophilus TaxID=549003 RepID=A0A1G8JGR0_9BACI|nr:cytochrome c [Natribacillus halophilus]SDI30469.1 cytochrome c550 [Natribacillus halophilus]
MKRARALVILGAAAFIIGGCNGEVDEKDSEETVDAGEGMELYEDSCIDCHGENFEGTTGPSIAGYNEDEVLDAIEEGPGSMPEDLYTGEDAEAVAQYVEEEAG